MSLRLRAVRLVIRLKLAAQAVGIAPRPDVYVGCAAGYRYPATLLDALRLCGLRRIEVPTRDAVLAWGAVGFRNFLFRTRLVGEGGDVTAPVVVARDPDVVPGRRRSRVRISVDWFPGGSQADDLVLPYFPHPDLRRIWSERSSLATPDRVVRVGFAGTINREVYRDSFAFPMLTRADIFDEVLARFRDRIDDVRSKVDLEALGQNTHPIVLATVLDPRDSTAKHVLHGRDYLAFLGSCAFFLAPPGLRMPVCHNLVEGIAMGAIPILNYGEWLPEPLEDGVNCLRFSTRAELVAAIERALAISDIELVELQRGVSAYYADHLSVDAFARRLCQMIESSPTIVVNSERQSAVTWKERQRGPIDRAAR